MKRIRFAIAARPDRRHPCPRVASARNSWTRPSALLSIVLLSLLIPGFALAADEPARTSRLSFNPRVGFNVSAEFEGVGSGSSRRTTPNGDPYNYDNGYVLTDISGNQGGQTWYWGYDNSAAQVSGNNILLSRSTVSTGAGPVAENADPSVGGELVYGLELGTKGRLRYGFEAAAGYQHIRVQSARTLLVSLATETDAYPFMAGTTPPTATSSMPYQGTRQGPGFLIGDTATGTTSAVTPGVPLSSENELISHLWSLRFGPCFEIPVGNRLTLGLSGGIEGGMLHSTISWTESAGSYRSAGEVTDSAVLVGFYAAGSVSWQFADRWSLSGGVQYHNLGTYEHAYQGRTVKLDLNNAIYVTAGLIWRF